MISKNYVQKATLPKKRYNCVLHGATKIPTINKYYNGMWVSSAKLTVKYYIFENAICRVFHERSNIAVSLTYHPKFP